MIFPSPSQRLQRLLGGGVAALLTANAFAVASLVSDDSSASDRLGRPSATGDVIVPTAELPPTVALITTSDGRSFLADPSTPEGRRAIERASEEGGSVRTVAVPPTSSTATPGTKTPGVDTLLDLPDLLGSLLPSGGSNSSGGAGTGADDDGDGLLEIDPRVVGDLLDDPVGTATSIVNGVTGTVSSIVQSTPSTLTSVVNGATSTVSSILNQAPVTLPPILPTVTLPPVTIPPLTVPPLGGLLGQVLTTVVSVVGTVAPPPPPPPTPPPPGNPVCALLVLC